MSKAENLLGPSCFDENYAFLRRLIMEAARHAKPQARMGLVMSDQSDLALVHRLLVEAPAPSKQNGRCVAAAAGS